MTRETKIGLLVGLAFIIVIGILLSDHLTSSTEPPQAPLAQAGNSVRAAVGQPASINPPITNVGVPNNAAPRQPVATRDEITKPQVNQIIQLNPPTNEPGTPVAVRPDSSTGEVPVTLQDAARQHGEELVSANGPAAVALAMSNKYVAQPNDSVSKMAAKFLGGNTKVNRQAIINANASLKENPNKVIVGRTYTIPGATIADGQVVGLKPAPAAPAPTSASPAQIASSPERVYTVQSGDNLSKIARTQLGDEKDAAAIQQLNQDVLKGSTMIRAGMKLRLPMKNSTTAAR